MFASFVVISCNDDLLVVGETGIVSDGMQEIATGAFGLEAAKLVDGTAEKTVGVRSGSVNGPASIFGGFVEHGVFAQVASGGGVVREVGFDGGAAAETPGGSGDLGDEGLFEESFGTELGVKGFAEFFV
jgi:hypothetical protein